MDKHNLNSNSNSITPIVLSWDVDYIIGILEDILNTENYYYIEEDKYKRVILDKIAKIIEHEGGRTWTHIDNTRTIYENDIEYTIGFNDYEPNDGMICFSYIITTTVHDTTVSNNPQMVTKKWINPRMVTRIFEPNYEWSLGQWCPDILHIDEGNIAFQMPIQIWKLYDDVANCGSSGELEKIYFRLNKNSKRQENIEITKAIEEAKTIIGDV